jgi:hypothetical protein
MRIISLFLWSKLKVMQTGFLRAARKANPGIPEAFCLHPGNVVCRASERITKQASF